MSTNYDLKSVKLPRLAGGALKAVCNLMENDLMSSFIIPSLLRDAGITHFRTLNFEDSPVFMPMYAADAGGEIPTGSAPARELIEKGNFRPPTILDYAKAYQSGDASPSTVAEQFLKAVAESDQGPTPLRSMVAVDKTDIRTQAAASTARWQQGKPLSQFDGVPIPIKDELDQTPYPTTVGTSVLGKQPASQDSTAAARLRKLGALLVGKANMHEIGIGVTGLNPHHGTTRNPYAPTHFTGGSSSGPAAAVSSGLAPVAIGADGGGSIRIPASFCGIVGLKATFGRVSEFGAAPLCWSVAHVGPLANTALDAALTYAAIAGPDSLDPNSLAQPPISLAGFDNFDLKDLKIGVYWPWFRHAESQVVSVCEKMLSQMEKSGAKIIEIEVTNLEAIRVAHIVTIGTEMYTALAKEYAQQKQMFGLDVRTNLAIASHFKSSDYVLAQKVRAHAMKTFTNVLQKVDVIALPATGISAPIIPPDALPAGESDLTTLLEIMRFATPGNLTGLPAISFPAGYTDLGMPIGFQMMGKPWHEHTLLRLAHFAETICTKRKPKLYWDLLS